MPQLNDKCIRLALRSHLAAKRQRPRAVLEEIRVHNGNAIADVVEIGVDVHCYEIKGETDVVQRIARQGYYYDQAFPLVTLVTTRNHLTRACEIAPDHWGLMLAETNGNGSIAIRAVRAARENQQFNKEVALLTLWKSELLSLVQDAKPKTNALNRKALTQLLAEDRVNSDVCRLIADKLVDRYASAPWSMAI